MKKMIFCMFLAMCSVFILCSCSITSKTPFDKLSDNPSYTEAQKRYGGDGDAGMNGFGWIQLSYNYPWHGCNGELKITYSADYGNDLSIEGHQLESASWEYSGHDLAKTRDDIVKQLESKNGKANTRTDKFSNGKKIVNTYWWEVNGDTRYKVIYTIYEGVDTIECRYYAK